MARGRPVGRCGAVACAGGCSRRHGAAGAAAGAVRRAACRAGAPPRWGPGPGPGGVWVEPAVRWLRSLSAVTEGEPGEGREPFELPPFWDALGTGGERAGGGRGRPALGRGVGAGLGQGWRRAGPWRRRVSPVPASRGARTRGRGPRKSPGRAFAPAFRSGMRALPKQGWYRAVAATGALKPLDSVKAP